MAFKLSYLPNIGLAVANTEVLEFKIVQIPALAILIVYFFIASWINTLSSDFIYLNFIIHYIM